MKLFDIDKEAIRITNRERMEKQNSRRVKIEDSALISRNIYIYGSTRRTRVLPREDPVHVSPA